MASRLEIVVKNKLVPVMLRANKELVSAGKPSLSHWKTTVILLNWGLSKTKKAHTDWLVSATVDEIATYVVGLVLAGDKDKDE